MKLYEIINMIMTVGLVVTAIVFTTIFIVKVVKVHKKKPNASVTQEEVKTEEKSTQDAELEEMKELFKESTAKPQEKASLQSDNSKKLKMDNYRFGGRADKSDEDKEISVDSEISTGSVEVEPKALEEVHTKYKLAPSQMIGRKVRTRDIQDMLTDMSPEVRMLLLTDIFKPKF